MAIPASVTLQNLNGKYAINNKLSGDIDPILALQGLKWMLRKTITMAPITMHLTQSVDDAGVMHIKVENMVAGKSMNTENRDLDGIAREIKSPQFKLVNAKSEWISTSAIEDGFLCSGWEAGGEVIRIFTESLTGGWTLEQIWGLQEIQGQRYYVRQLVGRKGKERKQCRLVYNWVV